MTCGYNETEDHFTQKAVIAMKSTIKDRFQDYPHSIPILFSHLEGQYPYETIENDGYTIVLTPLGFHYVTGTVPSEPLSFVDTIKTYLKKHDPEEFLLFGPDESWDAFLTEAFGHIRGITDQRFAYRLNLEQFRDKYDTHTFMHKVTLDVITDELSTRPYLQASIRQDDDIVSYCRAFLVGRGEAELDVFTNDKHRKQGMAHETSLYLIQALLERDIVPNWTCWRIKEASQHLAKRLGFEQERIIQAHVWVREFGLE